VQIVAAVLLVSTDPVVEPHLLLQRAPAMRVPVERTKLMQALVPAQIVKTAWPGNIEVAAVVDLLVHAEPALPENIKQPLEHGMRRVVIVALALWGRLYPDAGQLQQELACLVRVANTKTLLVLGIRPVHLVQHVLTDNTKLGAVQLLLIPLEHAKAVVQEDIKLLRDLGIQRAQIAMHVLEAKNVLDAEAHLGRVDAQAAFSESIKAMLEPMQPCVTIAVQAHTKMLRDKQIANRVIQAQQIIREDKHFARNVQSENTNQPLVNLRAPVASLALQDLIAKIVLLPRKALASRALH
jgi:hypothetical protein